LGAKKIEIEIETSMFAVKIDHSFRSPHRSNTNANNVFSSPDAKRPH